MDQRPTRAVCPTYPYRYCRNSTCLLARLPNLGPRRCARAGQGRSGFYCARSLRNLATVKFGSSWRPASRASCASAARPLSADAAARKNWGRATFGFISTDFRSRSRADSSRPRNRSAIPSRLYQRSSPGSRGLSRIAFVRSASASSARPSSTFMKPASAWAQARLRSSVIASSSSRSDRSVAPETCRTLAWTKWAKALPGASVSALVMAFSAMRNCSSRLVEAKVRMS